MISRDWIATNAARDVRVIGPRGEGAKRIVPPSKEDLRKIIDVAKEDVALMLIFAASTGARAGEQWAARWRNIDLDKGELRISRRVDAYREEGAPKSAAAVRMCRYRRSSLRLSGHGRCGPSSRTPTT